MSRLKSTEGLLYLSILTSTLILLLEWTTEGPILTIIVAPIGEELLKLSLAGLLSYELSLALKRKMRLKEKESKIVFFLLFVWLSAIFGLIMGYSEYSHGGNYLNICSHFSFTTIGAILIASWMSVVKRDHRKYGILFAGVSILLHSISNQYANFKSITRENEYLVSMARFLANHTPLTEQVLYEIWLFRLAFIMFVASTVLFPLLLTVIHSVKSPKR